MLTKYAVPIYFVFIFSFLFRFPLQTKTCCISLVDHRYNIFHSLFSLSFLLFYNNTKNNIRSHAISPLGSTLGTLTYPEGRILLPPPAEVAAEDDDDDDAAAAAAPDANRD